MGGSDGLRHQASWPCDASASCSKAAPQRVHTLTRLLKPACPLLPSPPLSALGRFDFGEAGRLLYDFVWSDFADWYIEAAKAKLYSGDEAAARQVRAGRRVLGVEFLW